MSHTRPLSGSTKTLILTVVGCLLLVAAGAGTWIVLRRQTATPTTNTNTNAPFLTNQGTSVIPVNPLLTPPNASESPKDTDGDGLADDDEAKLGTKPDVTDTDDDGLSDRAEVRTFGTNPLKADTDGDGINDGDEVRKGDNPNGTGKLLDLHAAVANVNS